MITIFAIKPFSGDSADGIDNVNMSIFREVDPNYLTFFAEASSAFKEVGSIKKLRLKNDNCLSRYIEKIRLLREIKPDYLFGIGNILDIPFICLKPQNTKYVIDWHTALVKNEGYWRVITPWSLRNFIFNRADLIIAVSEFSADSVRRYFPHKKIVAILNGVDYHFFSPAKRNREYLQAKYGIKFDKPVASFVGMLHPRKRPDLVLNIAKECETFFFVFVGRNLTPWNFSKAIADSDNAQWVPAMPREDVAILLASSDIFIFPSLNETCAAVIAEAMASGLPVIASQSGGNSEMIVDNESGFLIPVGQNEKSLFLQKLCLLLDVQARRKIGSAARTCATTSFSWDKVAQRYVEIFNGGKNIVQLDKK